MSTVVREVADSTTYIPKARPKTRWGTHLALIIVCFLVAVPAFYALLVSTMTRDQAFQYPPRLVPGGDFVDNVETLMEQNFGRMFVNTAMAAVIVVVAKT